MSQRGDEEYFAGIAILTNLQSHEDEIKAGEHFLRALELGCDAFNKEWIGWSSLFTYFQMKNDVVQACDAARKVLEFDPQEPNIRGGALEYLAAQAALAGDFKSALDLAEKGLTIANLDPVNVCRLSLVKAEALFGKTQGLFESGDWQKVQFKEKINETRSAFKYCKEVCKGVSSQDPSLAGVSSDINNRLMALNAIQKGTVGGCFIATAVYGSYDAPEVLVLRQFRDLTLARSSAGRLLIRSYYAISPALAGHISNTQRLRKFIREDILNSFSRLLERKYSGRSTRL